MDKEQVQKALETLKNEAQKRNFSQTVELLFALRGLDLKKPEQQLDFYMTLPHGTGKKVKICALVGGELVQHASEVCDKTIVERDFDKFAQNLKEVKKLAREYEYFIAQATVMPKVATAFGRVLGPKRKMPNPKAGCVVPPKTNLRPLYEKLQKSVRIYAKEKPHIQCVVGKESMKEEEIVNNVMAVYESVIAHLPNERNNVKHVAMKLTMSKPVRLM